MEGDEAAGRFVGGGGVARKRAGGYPLELDKKIVIVNYFQTHF